MVITVIALNSLIGLLCCYAAWQVWCWQRSLAMIADQLVMAEHHTHRVLRGAPNAIVKGQWGIHQLRQQTRQLQQLQQLLALVGLGRSLWLGRSVGKRSSNFSKSSNKVGIQLNRPTKRTKD